VLFCRAGNGLLDGMSVWRCALRLYGGRGVGKRQHASNGKIMSFMGESANPVLMVSLVIGSPLGAREGKKISSPHVFGLCREGGIESS